MAYGEELVGEWGPPPQGGRVPVDEVEYLEQFRQNCLLTHLPVLKLSAEHKKIMVMVCGGPSAKLFLDDIRKKRADDRYRIFCSNKTHDWLIENGIIPHYQFIIDPKESKVEDVQHPHKDVEYLIGASCHPKVFEALKDYKVTRVISLSGTTVDGMNDVKIAEAVFKKGKWAPLEGGTMAGLRAMCLGRVMGYTTVEFYGFDSCYFETTPEGEPIYYSYDKKRAENITECKCDDGRIFLSTPVFASQAREFIKWKHRLEWMKFVIYGDGFIAHLDKLDAELNKPKTDLRISPYMLTMNKQMFAKDEKGRKTFGTSGAESVAQITLLAGQLIKKYGPLTLLDYGCGEGKLFKSMPVLKDLEFKQYDPCIKGLDVRPEPADIVVCTDVLEHAEPVCLENVLDDLQKLTKIVCFVSICLTPAGKRYPDGSNCHLSLLDYEIWYAKLRKRFLVVESSKSKNPQGHEKFICVLQSKDLKPVTKKTEKTSEQLAADYEAICNPLIDRLCSKCADNCCQECAENNAWFTGNIEMFKSEFGFDAKDGFLNHDKSCKLPRKYRSVRCQGYVCPRGKDLLTPEAISKLEEIDAHMRYAREKEGVPA